MLIDTHCHIHSKIYKLAPEIVIDEAKKAGVKKLILVGEDVEDSKLALKLAENHKNLYVTIGVHPHEAQKANNLTQLRSLVDHPKVIGIGECGLDYWYLHSSKSDQERVLRFQIELALELSLPMSLHIRGSKQNETDAFNDFFVIIDEYKNRGKTIRGVVHSFSSGQANLEGVLSRSLHVGLNGIATFSDTATQEVINSVPLESIVLETDAPYLTPLPERGKINQPKYLVLTAEYIAKQRGISFDDLVTATSKNASRLFGV